LFITAICVNRDEELPANDEDFKDIAKILRLRLGR